MCMYVCASVSVCERVSACVCVYVYVYVCASVSVCERVSLCASVCECVCASLCASACVSASACVLVNASHEENDLINTFSKVLHTDVEMQ